MEIIFLERCSEEVFTFIHLGQGEELLYTKRWKIFNVYKKLWTEGHNGTVKSSLKIPLQHNGVVPIKITGLVIKEHMAYFTTDDNSTKGRDPNISIINGIHKIKGKTSVNILVSNYTNKHIAFNYGEYIGCLEPAITDNMTIDDSETHSAHSVFLQKMMAEQVQPDIFDPPCHKLKPGIQSKLDTLLKGV